MNEVREVVHHLRNDFNALALALRLIDATGPRDDGGVVCLLDLIIRLSDCVEQDAEKLDRLASDDDRLDA